MAKKIELLHTTYDESGNIESQEVVHPLTSPDCIIMENGKTLDEVMGDGIATPTLTHEGTSFKVGVGDSNIEVVDGDVAGMTLKGQSYQNILPKPTTLIIETDEKEFKINDKIDSNIIIDDNIAEIATVKGKTIVNTVQEESGSEYTVLGEDLSGQSIVTSGKVDGNIKGVTLQGQTLVNTIQEPCKDDYVVLGADGIEISAETGGCGTIKDTVQGGINGAVLEGQTLVNLFNTKNIKNRKAENSSAVAGYDASTGTAHYLTNMDKTEPYNYSYISTETGGSEGCAVHDLKPNTTYTVKWFYQRINDVDPSKTFMRVGFSTNQWGSFSGSYLSSNVNIENECCIFTTPAEFREDITRILALGIINTSNSIEYKVKYVILEGDYTNKDIPYFEGMKSVQMPVLTTVGKNLFDGKMAQGTVIGATGIIMAGHSERMRSDYIPVNTNNITVSCLSGKWVGVFAYREDKSYIGYASSTGSATYETQEKISFVIISTEEVENYSTTIQVEENSIATEYEPYQSSTVTTEKNIFDGQLAANTLWDVTGEPSSELLTIHKHTLNYMSCNANEQYELHIKPGTSGYYGVIKVYYYDKDKNYLKIHEPVAAGLTSTQENKIQLTIPNNSSIAYMRFRFYKPDDVTTYTETTVDYLTIKQVYALRGIGDVKDELDLQTGKLTQRVEEIVLDGSQQELSVDVSRDNTALIIFNSTQTGLSTSSVCICDKLPFKANSSEDFEHMRMNVNGNVCFWINKTRLEELNVAGVKKYLLQNPITVQYPLVAESVKTIDLQVTDQDGNTIPHIQTQPNVTHITASSDYLIPTVTINGNLAYDTIIKPSSLYTVRFNHDTVNADNPLTVDLGGTVQTATSTEFTITTPSELTHNQLVFSGKNNVVSEVQVIEGDVTNIEYPFFEGMSDVKFSDSKFINRGKNLIHVSKGYGTTSDYNGLTVTRNGADQTITINGTCTLDNTSCELAPFYREFKKGERYAFSCKLISGTADRILFRVNDEQWKGNISCGLKATNSNIYETCIKTFYSDETYNRSSIRVDSGATFNNAVFKVMLEKIPVLGDYTPQYEPCKGVEVQQDVDSIPLTSDMFEQGTFTVSSIISGMSLQQIPTSVNGVRIHSKLIKVKPNTIYSCMNFGSTFGLWYLEFDKNGSYFGEGERKYKQNDVFQTTHNTEYVSVCVYHIDDSAIAPSDLDSMNLILQEVPQEIVLRGIGDVKDELDLTRGEYIQRIVEYVFDEKYKDKNVTVAEFDSVYRFGIYMSDNLDNSYAHKAKFDKFMTNTDYEGDFEHAYYWNATYYFFINKDKVSGGTSAAFKEYIKNNPITTHSVIKTPIIHKVNLTNTKAIQSYSTETHYETITPSDSLIPNITIPSTLNYNVAIKPSTEYTIRANTSDNLTVDLGGATGTLSNGKVTLTTPSTLTHNEVKFSGTGKVKELMVVEGNEIKDNVPFFNGMKNVEMGGIKLVNIVRYKSHANGVSVNTNKTTITFDDDGGVGTTSWGVCQFYDELLKPNTMYTIFMNVTKNTSTNEVPVKIQLGNASERFTNINRGFTGNFVEKIVTSSDISERTLALFFRRGQAGEKVVIQNPMIIEGDWTHLDEIPYIESEMIIEQPIIRSQGKNLLDLESKYFNPSNVTYTKSGTTYTVTGNTSNYNHGQFAWTTETSAWFRNLLGKEVTLSVSSISCTNANSKACVQVRMECTDGSKVFKTISINDSSKYVTFTIPSNAKNMALQLMSNNTGSPLDSESTLTVSNIQLELGNTPTSYEPYKHQTLYSNRVIGYEDGCYYTWDTGTKASAESIASVMSDVEGLNVAYVTHASSNFSFYDKDGVYLSGSMFLSTATDFDRFGFIKIPANAKYMKMACGNANSSAAKDYHLKATVTGELPLRSLPNGVCDSFNLITGEYVQRVGEVVLDGSESWNKDTTSGGTKDNTAIFFTETNFNGFKPSPNVDYRDTMMLCDKFPIKARVYNLDEEGMMINQDGRIYIRINQSRLETVDMSGFKKFLSANNIKVECELVTPIVRKLGFTTKGNYREQVLDGSETWDAQGTTGDTIRFSTQALLQGIQNTPLFTNDIHTRKYLTDPHGAYEYISHIEKSQYVNVKQNKLNSLDVNGFIQWLSQNPIKVGYITSTQSSDSYSNIHKPIFFNNVDVQFLPQNIDIQPELTYQVRTRNSYVMDMMKANTKYSVKLLLNTGEFVPTIDGVNNPLVNGRTFTSPSTLTNKLLITPCIKELMIIEGDVTGKNLPYFKGILSSYHNVDEIEVYSVNKNLFDMSKVKPYEGRATYWWNTIVKENEVVSVRIGDINNGQFGAYIKLNVRPNSTYTLYIEMEKDGEPYNGQIYGYENDDLWGNGTFTGYANTPYHINTSHNAKYITIGFNYGKDLPIGTTLVSKNMRLYLGEESPVYIPHAHSTTLIEMPTRLETVKVVRPVMEKGCIINDDGTAADSPTEKRLPFIPVQPGEILSFRNGNDYRAMNIHVYDINKNFIKYIYTNGTGDLIVPDNCYFIRGFCRETDTSDLTIIRQAYKPIQLNSLPNGVCDEIIMKPNSNKAQLVQRVGKVVLDGSGNHYPQPDKNGNMSFIQISGLYLPLAKGIHGLLPTHTYCDKLMVGNPHFKEEQGVPSDKSCVGVYQDFVRLCLHELDENEQVYRNYLQQNPLVIYYELDTPIIHEIQLKGYPHVYENGTVTLNTDTPHQTLVSYNVNQEQLINTQNETIIRHDQQIDDLYYYIEMYLEEIYQMELFRMKLELSL